jgi:hypothetical protein
MHRRRKIGLGLVVLSCVAAAAAGGLSNGILIGSKVEIHPRHEARAGRTWVVNDMIAVCRYLTLSGTAEIRVPVDGVDRPCKLVGPAA